MPSSTAEFLVLKLDTGYNVGIRHDHIKEILIEAPPKHHAPAASILSENAELVTIKDHKILPIISILHTGGTIASKVDYETGGVIARYEPLEIISMFPELKEIASIRSRLLSNMWSEDMRFAHYNIMAAEIKKEIEAGANGIIITHGTDTLHYTGAALSFMLHHLPIPVLLVGSQRSSDRGSSDAAVNLLCAAYFIAKSEDFADVALCMHETSSDTTCVILPGTKSRKMHSSRRDAFKPINTTPWARVSFKEKKIEMLKEHYRKKPEDKTKRQIEIKPFKEDIKVGFLKIHPNMNADEFLFYKGYAGLLIEGLGIAGNVPINTIDEATREHAAIAQAIRGLNAAGTVVAATTQTIAGSVNMNVYSTGRKMQEIGIIGNYTDMTPETGFIKLAWLLSNYEQGEVKKRYVQNLAGEISERMEYND